MGFFWSCPLLLRRVLSWEIGAWWCGSGLSSSSSSSSSGRNSEVCGVCGFGSGILGLEGLEVESRRGEWVDCGCCWNGLVSSRKEAAWRRREMPRSSALNMLGFWGLEMGLGVEGKDRGCA